MRLSPFTVNVWWPHQVTRSYLTTFIFFHCWEMGRNVFHCNGPCKLLISSAQHG